MVQEGTDADHELGVPGDVPHGDVQLEGLVPRRPALVLEGCGLRGHGGTEGNVSVVQGDLH